jgi:hypothetical protein
MPLLDRGELVGLLYVENELTRGVFTADRVYATSGVLVAHNESPRRGAELVDVARRPASAIG